MKLHLQKKEMNFILITILVVFIGVNSFAAIIDIPYDFPSIQEGIDVCGDGDTVIVQPGIYYENINFNGHNIVLGSLFLITDDDVYISSTVIDGSRSGSVITFENNEDSTAVITGFTIRHGAAYDGGGIYCVNTNPTINANIIIRNNAIGGIYTSGRGGGIFCDNANPVITNNEISSNNSNFDGGGIYCNNSDPVIINNILSENRAFSGSGGGIYINNSTPYISNNTISRNSIGWEGSGGGIYCWDSSPVITNTILWINTPSEIIIDGSSSPEVTYCDIRGGYEGEGNINIFPQFIEPSAGNYNICAQSPCVDAGDIEINDPDGSRSDIGVFFEEHPECFVGNNWHVSVSGSDSTGNGSESNPYRTIQYTIDNSIHGDTIIVHNGLYQESVSFNGKCISLVSEFILSGDTIDIENTIIENDTSLYIISFDNGEDSLAVIAGFTIRNGTGSGIGCYSSNPTIKHNIITGNQNHGVYCSFASPVISRNIIIENSTGNFGGGIFCLHSDPEISYNLIINNTANSGGGIYCYYSKPAITNNTVYGNSAIGLSAVGGGIYCSMKSAPTITNTIFWNNFASTYGNEIYVAEIAPFITYCDIQGGWSGEGNLDENPLFCNTEDSNFQLADNSPCVGNGENGENIGALDIGCLATNADDIIQNQPQKFELIQNYPNPFNENTTILFSISHPQFVTLKVYDLLGRETTTLVDGYKHSGDHRVNFDASRLASGIYLYCLKSDNSLAIKRMTLLK